MQNWNPTLWFPADCNHQQDMSATAYAEHAAHAAHAASTYLYPEHVLTLHKSRRKWTHHLCTRNKLLKRPLSWVAAAMMERLWLRELLCEEFQPWNLTGAAASILTGLVSLRSVNAPPAVITVTSVKIQHELHLWEAHLMVYDGFVQAGISWCFRRRAHIRGPRITRCLRTLDASNCCVLWEVLLNHKSATETEMCRCLLLGLCRYGDTLPSVEQTEKRAFSRIAMTILQPNCKVHFNMWFSLDLAEILHNGLGHTGTILSIFNLETITESYDF